MSNANEITPRLLSVEQAGQYLGRTPGAIRQLIYRGYFPAVKAGRRVQIDRYDLDKFITAYKVKEDV